LSRKNGRRAVAGRIAALPLRYPRLQPSLQW